MMLKFKKKDHQPIETEDLAAKLSESNRKKDYFLLSIQALLELMKEFTMHLILTSPIIKMISLLNLLLSIFLDLGRIRYLTN